MVTEKECNEALEHIKTLRGSNYGWYYSGFNNSALPFDEDTNVISKLIEEHFSNPPLTFEELKEDMWVWDKKFNQWIQIDETWSSYKKFINVWIVGWDLLQTIEYEPDRFYRKEVKE